MPNSAKVLEVVSIPSAAASEGERAFEATGVGDRDPDAELDEPASEEDAEADIAWIMIDMQGCTRRWPKNPASTVELTGSNLARLISVSYIKIVP